jgi:cellulose synthase/poly-beta-1,6-N-acetylglucosamine synthase-like glycosyltransferase
MTIFDYIMLFLVVLLAYAWVGYPLVLGLLARGQRQSAVPLVRDDESPNLTVIFSAHNEESVIADRLQNLLDVDYPRDRLSILVGVDGGNDRTAEVAREFSLRDARIEVHVFEENRGKVAVLKDLVEATADDNILVFTDANTRFEMDALKRLVGHFVDPRVGGVCGKLIFTETSPFEAEAGNLNPSAEGVYWRWEAKLKEQESALDSCLGANGAIYAIRSECFWDEMPDNTIVDDLVIGMKVRERGLKMIYAPEALAYEELPELTSEWGRRVRIGAGDFQALALCRKSLSPRHGFFAWSFWSHKILRWFTPHLLVGMVALAGLGFLSGECLVSRVVQVAVLAGLGVGMLCLVAERVRPGLVGISHVSHFMSMQAALMAGFIRFLRGDLRGSWSRTPRGSQEAG